MTAFNPQNAPNVNRYINKGASLQPSHIMKLWRERPVIFAEDVFDIKYDAWQEHYVDLYMNHSRVAAVASKGPGKTFTLATIGWHFFITRHLPKMAALSITKDHLKSNLWAELRRLRAQSELIKRTVTDGESRLNRIGHEGYSFIDARSFPKSADENQQASSLAGLHADNVAFLIDEAGSIPDAVINTADAALSTGSEGDKCAKMLITANPEQPRGVVYRAYMGHTKQDWAVMTISGDPEDPKRASRVDLKWAQEMIDQYGREDPWVMINVLGKYPRVGMDTLLSDIEVREAQMREVSERDVANSQCRLGLDVARGGVDRSSFARRRGLIAYPLEVVGSDINGPGLAGMVAKQHLDHRVERVFVDNTGGFGSSVVDALDQFPHIDVTPVHYSSKAQDQRYFNKRTEMWMRMRDWVRKGGVLPKDPMLAEELCAVKFFTNGGKIRLEEKDQVKSRLGRSPDRADALAQTFADVEQPSFYAEYGAPQVDPHSLSNEEFQKGLWAKGFNNHLSDESQLDPYYNSGHNHRA
jgi:phage terminase large subunit